MLTALFREIAVIDGSQGGNPSETRLPLNAHMSVVAFAAGGWWAGFVITGAGIAVLAALVVAVITTVNRLERQAASIVAHLDEAADATRPLLDLVETNQALAALRAG